MAAWRNWGEFAGFAGPVGRSHILMATRRESFPSPRLTEVSGDTHPISRGAVVDSRGPRTGLFRNPRGDCATPCDSRPTGSVITCGHVEPLAGAGPRHRCSARAGEPAGPRDTSRAPGSSGVPEYTVNVLPGGSFARRPPDLDRLARLRSGRDGATEHDGTR